MVKSDNFVSVCLCARLLLYLKNIEGGSAMSNLKTSFPFCHRARLSVYLHTDHHIFCNMTYIELNIPVSDPVQSEIVVATLSDFPFESFSEEGTTLKAYIPKEQLIDCKSEADAALENLGIQGATYIEIEPQNWNALWESNFTPVEVEGTCTIRAPFSPPPQQGLDIVIMPKMSFGTGHHDTTYLMTAALMERDLTGKRGLDMGSGTGILSIVAVKRGAIHVDAVDIDEWAYENCIENCTANAVSDSITPILGDASAITTDNGYDFILANINRNILLNDMPRYAALLASGGELLMSGILKNDADSINRKAFAEGLTVTDVRTRNDWVLVCCCKSEGPARK